MKQTPQERKIQDYTHKRKNSYGENDKSSRNALRKRKRWVNRSYRRSINNLTNCNTFEPDEINEMIASAKRYGWKKYPYELVLENLDHKWSGSSRSKVKPHQSGLRNEAIKRLKHSKTGNDL